MRGCLIVPIYDQGNDFNYGVRLYKSGLSYGVDVSRIYFVFSNEEQKDKFTELVNSAAGSIPQGIVLDKSWLAYGNQISVKKWYGCLALYKQYDVMAAIDCECEFYGYFNIDEVLTDVWEKETFLACNKSFFSKRVLRKSLDVIGLREKQLLYELTDNCSFYWWFNDIPVYLSDTFEEFWNWLLGKDSISIFNDWSSFDYLVYVYWLTTEKNFKLRQYNYFAVRGVIADLYYCNMDKARAIEKEMGTHWTSREIEYNSHDIALRFHADRANEPMDNEELEKTINMQERMDTIFSGFSDNDTIVIYGAGFHTWVLLEYTTLLDHEVKWIVDKNKDIKEFITPHTKEAFEVREPVIENLATADKIIISSLRYQKEIRNYLTEIGLGDKVVQLYEDDDEFEFYEPIWKVKAI